MRPITDIFAEELEKLALVPLVATAGRLAYTGGKALLANPTVRSTATNVVANVVPTMASNAVNRITPAPRQPQRTLAPQTAVRVPGTQGTRVGSTN